MTQQILSTSILIPNHALYGLISSWCEANGVEPPKRSGNLWLCKTTSDGSSEFIDLDILVSKLSSNDIEELQCAVGEHFIKHTSSLPFSLSDTHARARTKPNNIVEDSLELLLTPIKFCLVD